MKNYKSELVEAEALAWVAQLNGDSLTEQDLAAFREWVNRSPAHAREIQELASFWGELNVLTSMDEPIRQADALQKKFRRRSWRVKPIYALSGLTAAGLIAFFGFQSLSPSPSPTHSEPVIAEVSLPIIYQTDLGEQLSQELEDGSSIVLNTNSRVEVDYTEKQRTIRLKTGEALFSVEHDPARPFVVFAEDGVVRALGTEFSVRIIEDGLDVVVAEGSVELSSIELIKKPDQNQGVKTASLGVIEAGQGAQLDFKESEFSLQEVHNLSARHGWKSGDIVFTGETLEFVVAELARYSDLQIVIEDPEIKNRRFGGVLKIGQTDQLFDILEAQYGIISISENHNTIRLIQRQ